MKKKKLFGTQSSLLSVIVLVAAIAFTMIGCPETEPDGTVATPVANPAAGTYTSAQNVALTSDTSGASIYYTLNGDTPTDQSTLYSGAIAISATTTLKAIAIKSGMNNSEVLTAVYTISTTPLPDTVATPEANPPTGTYTSAQSVALSTATSGASIFYTINGDMPTDQSTPYSSAIAISATTTLKAIAVKSGMNDSGVLTAVYTINTTGSGGITLDVGDILGNDPVINEGEITISRSGADKTYTVTVSDPDDYDSIAWEIAGAGVIYAGAPITGTDATFTLDAEDTRYNVLGQNSLILTVEKDGMSYQTTIPFTVVE